jgi:hypothetical protein
MHLFLFLFLSVVVLSQCKALSIGFNLFHQKPKSYFELAREMVLETVHSISTHIINYLYQAAITHTMIIINIITLVITIVVAIKILKGRHHKVEGQNSTACSSTAPVAAIVHFNSTMQMQPEPSNTGGNQSSVLTNVIKQPQEYTGRSNVNVWLAKLEIYLQNVCKSKWTDTTISLLSDDFLKSMGDINVYREDQNGFEKLRTAIIEKTNAKPDQITQSKSNQNHADELASRKQKQYENIRSYGEAFIKLAREAFPNIELQSIDDFLKRTFQKGIANKELKLIALEKLIKMNSKQEKSFTIEKFIEYLHNKENARD